MSDVARAAPRAPRTILVVDDDPEVRDSIVDVLDAGGYRVLTAANGLDALRVSGGNLRPDLILLDMLMPIMDGRAFRAEQQRRPELSSIPVVIVTAYGMPEDNDPLFEGVEVLRKPFGISHLLETVERRIRDPEPRRGGRP